MDFVVDTKISEQCGINKVHANMNDKLCMAGLKLDGISTRFFNYFFVVTMAGGVNVASIRYGAKAKGYH